VPNFSDAALIARVLAGDDRNAFGELVRRYQSQVRGLLMKLTAGDKSEADDLAQETFIRAYRHLGKFRAEASFATWLHRIAYTRFLESKRRSDLVEYQEDIDETAAAQPYSASAPLLARIDVEKAMAGLKPMERAALMLSYGHGAPHEEIARTLECPLGTVKTLINRARAKMARKLAPHQQQEQV
jgi:RNA polymerase sigma-70 factor (ECF subfamily)